MGSGISGTFVALGILERDRGARIVMVEARGACSGATGRNGMYECLMVVLLPLWLYFLDDSYLLRHQHFHYPDTIHISRIQ